MNHKDRCALGELAKKCDEKHLEIEVNSEGKVIGFKKYCRAKDMKRR